MARYKVLKDGVELKSFKGTFTWDKGSEVGDDQVAKETPEAIKALIDEKSLKVIKK